MSDEQKSKAEETKNKSVKKVEVPAKFKSLVEEIEKMSVLDLSELVKILEDKFGVSASTPVMVAPGAGAGVASADASATEAKSEFDIELTSSGNNKIAVIKIVREVAGKGLKEAKDMTEGAPVIIKAGVKKEEAEEIKKKLEEAGAQAILK